MPHVRMRLALRLTVVLPALLGACAGSPRAAETPSETAQVSIVQSPSPKQARPPEALNELNAWFEAEKATGTIALFDSATGQLGCSDVALCQLAVIPASTFKIPNSLIALELGLLQDPDSVMPWDGQPRIVQEWNRDHTLRSAVRESCVPCFQSIARSVGMERMRHWLDRFDYGNRDTSGGLDRFWLTGGLRISPVEQITFLRRLESGTFPVQPRTLENVRDILTLDVGQNHVLRGKTGLSRPPESDRVVGWFVGWVELGERRVFYATLVDSTEAEVDVVPLRRRLTEEILRARGTLPD